MWVHLNSANIQSMAYNHVNVVICLVSIFTMNKVDYLSSESKKYELTKCTGRTGNGVGQLVTDPEVVKSHAIMDSV